MEINPCRHKRATPGVWEITLHLQETFPQCGNLGIFLTQRSNLDLLCLLHCRGILYHWSHQGSLENMEETKRNSTAVIAYKVTLIWDALPPWPTACRYGSKFLGQWSLPKAGLPDLWGHHPGHAVLPERPLRTQVCHKKRWRGEPFLQYLCPFL